MGDGSSARRAGAVSLVSKGRRDIRNRHARGRTAWLLAMDRLPRGWFLYSARFHAPGCESQRKRRRAWVTVSGGYCFADFEVSVRTHAHARTVSRALRRAGYTVGGIPARRWIFARRRLHGVRVLDAELTRLESLVDDVDALRSLPRRTPRPNMGGLNRRVPRPQMEHLRRRKGWTWTMSAVGRGARPTFFKSSFTWSAFCFCTVLEEDGDRSILLGASVLPRQRRAKVRRDDGRAMGVALEALLTREGYRGPRSSGGALEQSIRSVYHEAATLAEARHARARLDALVFGPIS